MLILVNRLLCFVFSCNLVQEKSMNFNEYFLILVNLNYENIIQDDLIINNAICFTKIHV